MATSQRKSPVVEDYNLAAGERRGMTQPRIDTGSWTQKDKNSKEAIGKAWSKFFHITGELEDRLTVHILSARSGRHRSRVSFFSLE